MRSRECQTSFYLDQAIPPCFGFFQTLTATGFDMTSRAIKPSAGRFPSLDPTKTDLTGCTRPSAQADMPLLPTARGVCTTQCAAAGWVCNAYCWAGLPSGRDAAHRTHTKGIDIQLVVKYFTFSR